MKFYNNLAIIISLESILQVLLQVDVLLGSNQHEGLLITQVNLCLVSNVIHQIKNNFFLMRTCFFGFQPLDTGLQYCTNSTLYSVTSISNITEFVTQLFLAWPQLFGIMMSTWQVWGPILLLQVTFFAFCILSFDIEHPTDKEHFHVLNVVDFSSNCPYSIHYWVVKYALPFRRSLYQRQVRTTPQQTCCWTSTPMGWGPTSPLSNCPLSLI